MNQTKQLIFFKNLYKAVKSGLPPGNFFNRLAQKSSFPGSKNIYAEISREIERGSTITQALSKHSEEFDKLYISLINAGEKSGKLDEILNNIINIIENNIYLNKKITTTLRQPLINIGGAILGFGILIFALVPALIGFFGSFDFCPPFITKIIFFLQQNIFSARGVFLVVFAALALALIDFYKSEIDDISKYFSYKQVKFPIVGDLIRWSGLYIYFLVLKSSYTAGLSFIESTELAGSTIQNNYLKQFTDGIHEKSKSGEAISAVLLESREANIIEPEISELIEIGETTGRTDEAYNDVIKLLKDNIESKIDFICNITPMIGIIMAAAPVVIIIILVLGILTKASGIIMNALGQISL